MAKEVSDAHVKDKMCWERILGSERVAAPSRSGFHVSSFKASSLGISRRINGCVTYPS
jgi:hypothetical protein